jgi:hypothetical protein
MDASRTIPVALLRCDAYDRNQVTRQVARLLETVGCR